MNYYRTSSVNLRSPFFRGPLATLVVALTATLLPTACLFAQDTSRDLASADCDYSIASGSEKGALSLRAKSNTLKWWLRVHPNPALVGPTANPVIASLTLPFNRAGSIAQLSDREFLISGKNSADNHGWLLVVRLGFGANAATPSITTLLQRDLGTAIDPRSAAHNATDGHLYAFDESTRSLVRAPWTGVGAALPTSFATIMTATQLPMLAERGIQVAAAPAQSGCIAWVLERRALTQVRVYQDQSVWKIDTPVVSVPWNTQWALANSSIQKSQGPLLVKGPAAAVDLIDVLTGITVGSFTNPGGDQWNLWGLPSADTLNPGYAYRLQGGAYTQSRPFRPLIRWGNTAPADNVKIDRGHALASSAYIGSTAFAVWGVLRFHDTALALATQSTKTCTTHLYVNYYTPGVPAPITTVGSIAYLTPLNVHTIAQPTALSMTAQSMVPYTDLRYLQPIPNDPNLVNARIIWQWVTVTDNSAIVVSDVFGTSILDAPQQTSSASKSSAPSCCPLVTVSKPTLRALNRRMPTQATLKAAREFIVNMKGGRGARYSKQLWKSGLTALRLQQK